MCCASVSCHPDSRPVFFRSKKCALPNHLRKSLPHPPVTGGILLLFSAYSFRKDIIFCKKKHIYKKFMCHIHPFTLFNIRFSPFPIRIFSLTRAFSMSFLSPPAICPKIKKESPSSSKQLLPEILLYLHFLRTSPTDILQILIPFYPSDKHVYARRWVNRTSCPYGHIPPVRPRT